MGPVVYEHFRKSIKKKGSRDLWDQRGTKNQGVQDDMEPVRGVGPYGRNKSLDTHTKAQNDYKFS